MKQPVCNIKVHKHIPPTVMWNIVQEIHRYRQLCQLCMICHLIKYLTIYTVQTVSDV